MFFGFFGCWRESKVYFGTSRFTSRYYGAAFLPREGAPSPWTNLRVPRNEVREVLLARLEPGTVRFGCRAGMRRVSGTAARGKKGTATWSWTSRW